MTNTELLEPMQQLGAAAEGLPCPESSPDDVVIMRAPSLARQEVRVTPGGTVHCLLDGPKVVFTRSRVVIASKRVAVWAYEGPVFFDAVDSAMCGSVQEIVDSLRWRSRAAKLELLSRDAKSAVSVQPIRPAVGFSRRE